MTPQNLFNFKALVKYLLVWGIIIDLITFGTQEALTQTSLGHQFASNQPIPAAIVKQDAFLFYQHHLRFQKEVERRGEMDLDSMIYYGHAAIEASEFAKYKEGTIRIYLGLSSGFIDKTQIDSAKHYAKLAIDESTAIQDSHLLAKANLAYGWSLVYDKSNLNGAIEYSQVAYTMAETLKDTSLLINIGSKLVRIYFQNSDIHDAFKICSELTGLSKLSRDTSSLVYTYYLLGSIYAYAGLADKQMKIVYQALNLRSHIADTTNLYYINLTAANGYLFKQQYDSVLYYSRSNLTFCPKMKRMPYCYENVAKAFLETNMLDSAQYYYTRIMDYHKTHGTYIDTYLYLNLGRIQFALGNYPEALAYFKRAEADISKPSLTTQADIYKWLFTYYDLHKDDNAALFYHKKYKTWSDSLLTEQFGRSVMLSESKELIVQNQLLHNEKQLLAQEGELQVLVTQRLKREANLLYTGILLIFLFTWLGFKRFRKQRTLTANQELLKERLRISRELHDEVGATLSGIAMYSHVAVEQLKNSESKAVEHSLSFMQKSAAEMVNKLSDIVWLLNPEQDTIIELFGRLGEYGKQMTSVRDMQMRIDLPADLSSKQIPLDARRNIYLFYKEAINNAVKYSNGKMLVLQVKSSGEQMVFSVTDDGNGFDESIVRRGNGLVNMQKRAEDIGAVFHMASNQHEGTRLELQYKLIH